MFTYWTLAEERYHISASKGKQTPHRVYESVWMCAALAFVSAALIRRHSGTQALRQAGWGVHATEKKRFIWKAQLSLWLAAGWSGFESRQQQEFYCSPRHSYWFWGPPILMYSGYKWLKADHSPPATTDVLDGQSVTLILQTSSWHGALCLLYELRCWRLPTTSKYRNGRNIYKKHHIKPVME